MTRRIPQGDRDESLNIFQAFTDLMSNAFMIISFFLMISLVQISGVSKELQNAKEKLKSAEPIIIDERSGQFKFPSGRAEVTNELSAYIKTKVIPEIEKATKQGNIDFIQVIGHTDGQAIKNIGNLDIILTSAATGTKTITSLKAGSNADLGLMRSIAVVQLLQQTKGLKNVKFRAYSAAQLYSPDGKLATVDQSADDSRRRIEIRFIPHGQKKN
jgi:outer membrane protein OmpA-like peptidoglycan-associated protein